MPAYNLGMLLAGLPDPSMRQASSVISDPAAAQANYLADWQTRYDAATPVWVGGGGGGAPQGASSAPWGQAAITNAIANGANSEVFGVGPIDWGSGDSGYLDDSARRALDAEKTKQMALFGAQAANQQIQQNAYNQAGGGSFLGGNLNASYATPNTGLDPNSSLNGMLNTQPWATPGFGGPMGGTSQAGFGGPTGANATPQGWGGPFSARNPWAAS